jgi:hypothetical protein
VGFEVAHGRDLPEVDWNAEERRQRRDGKSEYLIVLQIRVLLVVYMHIPIGSHQRRLALEVNFSVPCVQNAPSSIEGAYSES